MFNFLKPKKPENFGAFGEAAAQDEYRRRGFSILAKNFFNTAGKRMGEIDFIASDKRALAFVEVKTRASEDGRFGSGAEAVGRDKQRRLLKAVKIYLRGHPELKALQPRIDVCLVLGSPLDKTVRNVTILVNAVEDWN